MQHRSTCLHALIRSAPTLALLLLSQDTTLLVPAGVRQDDSTILDALYQSLTTAPPGPSIGTFASPAADWVPPASQCRTCTDVR